MPKRTGLKGILLIEDNQTNQIVGGQRDATLEITIAELDMSSKDTVGQGWADMIAQNRSWTVSVSGAHVRNDAVIRRIRQSMIAPELTPETAVFPIAFQDGDSGEVFRGEALCTSLSKTYPHADLAAYDISFNGKGPLVESIITPNMAAAFNALREGGEN